MRLRATILGALVLCGGVPTRAQDAAPASVAPPSSAAPGETSFLVQNVTRAELWRFFEPLPDGGVHPDYAFVGSRSTLGARYSGPRWGLRGAIQYVRLENLPAGAIGPGLLGTGGAYFFQAGGTFSYQFYLRSLSLVFTDTDRGAWIEAGRFSRAAAEEPASGDETIGALTRAHLTGRLLGDMEWSMYQRAWDGVRGGVVGDGWLATITAAMPTQGTYEESANLTMDQVRVAAVEVRVDPDTPVPHTSLGAFAYLYDDRRRIAARPDNQLPPPSGRVATPTRADVRIGTAGASAIGAYPHRGGRWDALAWVAAQTGDWYGQRHRGLALAGQAGHQWTRARGRPWLRVGVDYASGDADALDGSHGTFFPMLPSGNQQARSNTYALMNVIDTWVETRVTPARAVDALAAVHRVGLARRADWWYAGSGATERTGNYFGFHARNNAGGRSLGTVIEGEVAWRATRWWTLRGYAGRIAGGEVVRNRFAGHRLFTAWLESVVSF
jgi:hypothetical protein